MTSDQIGTTYSTDVCNFAMCSCTHSLLFHFHAKLVIVVFFNDVIIKYDVVQGPYAARTHMCGHPLVMASLYLKNCARELTQPWCGHGTCANLYAAGEHLGSICFRYSDAVTRE